MTSSDIKSESRKMTALWIPGWHGLDQSMTVGESADYSFYLYVPKAIAPEIEVDLVFFNTVFDADMRQVRRCTVDRIEHSEVGQIKEILTDGLDYQVNLPDGRTFMVNAEEEPGRIYDPRLSVKNWTLVVQLSSVSAPKESITLS